MELENKPPLDRVIKKIVAIGIFLIILLCVNSILELSILTFIFCYFFYYIQKSIHLQISKFIHIPWFVITIFIYAVIIALIVLLLLKNIPIVTLQIKEVVRVVMNFNIANYQGKLDDRLIELIKYIDLESYVKQGGIYLLTALRNIGAIGVNIFIALILSLFFILGKNDLSNFGKKLATSRAAFVYDDFLFFGSIFLRTFGKVLELQIIFALLNAIASLIILFFLGFPQVLGLAFMIFILGLIPVIGVIISLVPLCVIGFMIGGTTKVIAVVILIIVIHILGRYVFYPKLAGDKKKLPIFLLLIVLILGQHFFGVAGLIIGMPLFMFLLDLAEVKLNHSKQRIRE